MLNRLLIVRLKAAENALRDGRLDEAHRLATAPDIRMHRRGTAVLAKLTPCFLERARSHFRADRFTDALRDLDRAETGGVMRDEIAELRDHVNTVAAAMRRQEESRRDRVAEARKRIEGGSLVAGRRILEQAGENDPTAEALRRKAQAKAEEAGAIVAQVDQLIAQGQLPAAGQRLRRAKAIEPHNEQVTQIESQLCERVFGNVRAALLDGRLSRASDELACLAELGHGLPAKRELKDLLRTAGAAARSIQDHDYGEARRHAGSLERLLPEATWIREVIEQLRQVEEARTALCSGPLGDRMDNEADSNPQPGRPISLDDTVSLPTRQRPAGEVPDALLLLVDGGGSYLVLRAPRITIGRAASANPADVPVFSDVAERHASVARVDDDYFLFTDKEVEVGGRRTPHQLLRDGDRVVLGRKAKLTFRLPSRKSPSAVLDLSDTTKMPNDVRRVILFHQHASLGSERSAHIRCPHAGPPLVLFERKGALWLRQRSDGHVDTEAVPLILGEPIEIAGASLVLQPWRIQTPGSRTM